ncbi:MAG: iron-sulfur cluster assembly scaffold protein [Planctomycetaceae bacterium]
MLDIYEDHILPHAHDAKCRGLLKCPTCTGRVRNPRCGDEVCIDLAIDDRGCITLARFEAQGCFISQAAADILCEHVEGQSVEAAAALRAETMLGLLGVPLTAGRYECALLALHCLRRLIDADCLSSAEGQR